MRIATLLPSATEIVCAFGLADCLVGVSHECDYPPDVVAELPKLTRSAIPPNLSSAEIDCVVSDTVRRGESLYEMEEELLAELKPDLLITQELCDVCAVSFGDVKRLAARLPGNPRVLSLNPPNLEGIFEDIETVAAATGCPEHGQRLITALGSRMNRVRARGGTAASTRVCAGMA